jgi:hypothetical protein
VTTHHYLLAATESLWHSFARRFLKIEHNNGRAYPEQYLNSTSNGKNQLTIASPKPQNPTIIIIILVN